MNNDIPRWHYRFDNFRRMLDLLREAVNRDTPLTQLETAGAIRRFEVTVDLACKSLKDYLENEGVELVSKTTRNIIRRAFELEIIQDSEVFQMALDDCIITSHRYDEDEIEKILKNIHESYLKAFDELSEFLMAKQLEES